MAGRNPVEGGFHLAVVRRVAALGGGVVGAVQLNYFASFFVLFHADALDEISVAQSYLAARRETEVILRRILAEILLLDVEDFRERDFPGTGLGIFGIVD